MDHNFYNATTDSYIDRVNRYLRLVEDRTSLAESTRRVRQLIGGEALKATAFQYLRTEIRDLSEYTDRLRIDCDLCLPDDQFWALSPWFHASSFSATLRRPEGQLRMIDGPYEFLIWVHGEVSNEDYLLLKSIGKIEVVHPEPRENSSYETVICEV